MSNGSDDSNAAITSGNRPVSVTNEEWNQQTIVDARSVVQTQQSNESLPQYDQQRSVNGKISRFFFINKFDKSILVNKQSSYPNRILHPEFIPSLNDVPAELNKRRNIRLPDPLSLETYETEIPMVVASSLQDELQRAVQNLYEKFSFFFFTFNFC
jgi:hypothetical protein